MSLLPAVLAHLSGCVLFQPAGIDCAAGEDCLADTHLPDTDPQDSDPQDTNPPVGDPELGGWAVSLSSDLSTRMLTELPVGGAPTLLGKQEIELAFALQDDSHLAGVLEDGAIYDLGAGVQLGQLPLGPQDVTRVNGQLIVGTQTNLYRNNNGVVTQISSVSFGELLHVHHDGAQGLYVVDYEDGSLRLLQGTSDGWTVLQRYDTSRTRTTDLFLGQGGQPMVCDVGGNARSIEALAGGDTDPWLAPTDILGDIVACGWDPGSQELVLLSRGRGLLRVDREGIIVSEQAIEGTVLAGVFL